MENETLVNNATLIMTKSIGDMTQSVTKLATIVDFLGKDISEIKIDVKSLTGQFIGRKEHEEYKAITEKRFVGLENTSSLQKWLSPAIASVVGSIITYLSIFYLSHLH